MRSQQHRDRCGCDRLRLAGVEAETWGGLRWRFLLADEPMLVTTSRDGQALYDVQHDAPSWYDADAGVGWPTDDPDLPALVGDRIREELARAALVAVLEQPVASRWAA